jgi:hypothetical protein
LPRYRCLFLLFAFAPLGCGTQATTAPATTAATPALTAPLTEGGLTIVSGEGALGDADYGQRKTTVFTLKNDTTKQLNLIVADKSCECAGVEIKPTTVAPGQTTQVTVAWMPKLSQSTVDAVRVRTTVQAENNPAFKVLLEADGRIKPTLRMNLPDGHLEFGKLLVGDLKDGRKELGIEVYAQDAAKKGFTLTAKSLSPGLEVGKPEPLSADRLSALNAAGGYRINVRAVPGLPAGAFREIVRLNSDVYPNRDLDVIVDGVVESGAVSLSRDMIELPAKIALARGYSCPPLEIELRGEPGRKLTIQSVEPKFLKARLEPVSGKDNLWRLVVHVPAGEAELKKDLSAEQLSEYTSFGFDGGAIVLTSDLSKVPILRIATTPSQFQR